MGRVSWGCWYLGDGVSWETADLAHSGDGDVERAGRVAVHDVEAQRYHQVATSEAADRSDRLFEDVQVGRVVELAATGSPFKGLSSTSPVLASSKMQLKRITAGCLGNRASSSDFVLAGRPRRATTHEVRTTRTTSAWLVPLPTGIETNGSGDVRVAEA